MKADPAALVDTMLRPPRWRPGNRIELLENGDAFFPRAFAAIASAQREVLVETFILYEDKVGTQLHACLMEAARRGVRVELTVDGFGSPGFSEAFVLSLVEAGARLHVYDPRRPLLGMRTNIFRRMHRKLLLIDGERAFVGGINYSVEHLVESGDKALQDYAIEITGPLVADIHAFASATAQIPRAQWLDVHRSPRGDADAMFAVRDNRAHRNDIEREYRKAIRDAKRAIIIANAYFFPSYRLLRDLRRAARRGVKVCLILQGRPDERLAQWAARFLYGYLIDAGVEVFEYGRRAFHGKVALVDDDWATVGSSNLDPLSLSLNLEANVFIRSRDFNATLRARLAALREEHCTRMQRDSLPQDNLVRRLLSPLAFHVVRKFPSWAGLLPAHAPRRMVLQSPPVEPS